MKPYTWLLPLLPLLSLMGADAPDIQKINFHSPNKSAVIERISDNGAPAVRFTAPVFSELRMPFQPPADYSEFDALEFQFKLDRTMGVGFGYLYSITDPKKWGSRQEFSLNQALGQGRTLPGSRWMTGRIKLEPSATFNPKQIRMISFGITDRHSPIDRSTPLSFMIKDFKLVKHVAAPVRGDRDLAAAFERQRRIFKPDLSPIVPAAPSKNGPAIVRDGFPAAEIVSAKNELPKSAEELRHWLKAITGAELPILAVPSSANNIKIFIGRDFAAPRYADDLARLAGSDGYAMRRNGNQIHLFGAEPRGTLNAVYAFLERNSDLIWPRPAPAMEAVFTPSRDFYAADCDALERPKSFRRGWGTNGGLNIQDEIWNTRNFCNAPAGGGGFDPGNRTRIPWGNFLTYGGGHNLYLFLSGKDYFEKHPEYYPLINGRRQYPHVMENNPCFTNPAMLDAFCEAVIARLRREALPPNSSLAIQIEDNWGLCECPGCLAPISLPDGTKLPVEAANFRSTQFFLWMNEVAERVLKEFPGLKFHTYAYFFTAPAPAVKVHPAVGVKFCPYVRPNDKYPMFSPVNGEWFDRLAAWSRISPRVILREYYGCGMAFPRPLAEVVANDLRAALKLGVREYTSEIVPDRGQSSWEKQNRHYQEVWDASLLDFWVITRLWWNPDQNVEQLRRYFYQRAFRTAAMPMARYYALLREAWYRDTLPSTCGDGEVNSFKHYIIGNHLEEPMRKLLDEAEKLADHPVSRELIRRHRARFEAWAKAARELKTPSGAAPLLTEPDFSRGLELTDFPLMGKPKEKAPAATSARIFHDGKSLHVRVFCAADPAGLTANGSKVSTERWTSGDHVELFLSDGKDPNRYYQFAVDCLGNRCNLDNIDRMKWNGQWRSAARKTAAGYEVDFIIPFETIRFTLSKPDLKMLLMRESGTPKFFTSWGGGKVHQPGEFGSLKLMR